MSAALLAMTCGEGSLPALWNETGHRLEVEAAFDDGSHWEGKLPRGPKVWPAGRVRSLDRLVVSRKGTVLFQLDRDDLDRLAQGLGDPRALIWVIEPSRVRAMTQDGWLAHLREKHR